MFLNPVVPLVVSVFLSSGGSSAPLSEADASSSCGELARKQEESDAAVSRLAVWMERYCPGALEDSEPFCRLQSHRLLERLDELGELKAALAAKGCERRDVRDAALPVRSPQRIGSFDDYWPWPRRPTFQAGLAATAGFEIRKCQADPDCEW